jgi:xanthine dehydrogenase iron-sulfur cluster and FAD-binding subunit A
MKSVWPEQNTVAVNANAAPAPSCSTDWPAVPARFPSRPSEPAAVLTIEGLERNGQLHPAQQAFLDEGGFQCAYCTSGMIISGVDLLNRNSNPSQSEIVRETS